MSQGDLYCQRRRLPPPGHPQSRSSAHSLSDLGLPVKVLLMVAPLQLVYRKFTRFVYNPVSAQLFRLQEFEESTDGCICGSALEMRPTLLLVLNLSFNYHDEMGIVGRKSNSNQATHFVHPHLFRSRRTKMPVQRTDPFPKTVHFTSTWTLPA